MRGILFLLALLCAFVAAAQKTKDLPFIKGVYGNPSALLKNGMSFNDLGINSIFVRSTSLDEALYRAAREANVHVFVEFPTLNGEGYVNDHPDAWPVNEAGERAPAADWFIGVCLTDSAFKQYREQQLRTLLKRFRVDGVWLDYLHWHAQFETPEPILPETCFCDRCTSRFAQETKTAVPAGEVKERATWILANSDSTWRRWRSEVLNGWVSHMKLVLQEVQPEALLGIYYCPWYPDDYDGALYRTLGLDMAALSKIADVFSPMLYHHIMDRPSEWVGEYVKWLAAEDLAGKRPLIWPIVQAHNKPGVITTEEFRQVMWNGSRAPATGIMMFTLHALISEPGKMQVVKDLYKKRR